MTRTCLANATSKRPRRPWLPVGLAPLLLGCGTYGIDPDPRNGRGAAAGLGTVGAASTRPTEPSEGAPTAPAAGLNGGMVVTLHLFGRPSVEFRAELVEGTFNGVRAQDLSCSGKVEKTGTRGQCTSDQGESIFFQTATAAPEGSAQAFCAPMVGGPAAWYFQLVDRQLRAARWSKERGAELFEAPVDGTTFGFTGGSGIRYVGRLGEDAVSLQRILPGTTDVSTAPITRATTADCESLLVSEPGGRPAADAGPIEDARPADVPPGQARAGGGWIR